MIRYVFGKNQFPITANLSCIEEGYEKHAHGQFEMVVVMKGSALHRLNDNLQSIKSGDVFVINRHMSHEFSKADNLAIYNVGFTEEVLNGIGAEIRKLSGFHALFLTGPVREKQPILCKLALSGAKLIEVIRLIEKLDNELSSEPAGFEVIARAYFHQLVVILSRQYSCSIEKLKDIAVINIARAASHIEENFNKELTLEQLAEIAGYSSRHFDRLFKLHYNQSPMQYLLEIRLEKARCYLQGTDAKLLDIALELGFYDECIFSKYFKRKYGVSPLRFRKNGRQGT